jgi:hypothetical protein
MKVMVAPPFAVKVVRYYLRDSRAAEAAVPAVEFDAERSGAKILVVGDQWNGREKAANLLAQYPRPLADFRGVRIYGRGPGAQ